MDSPPPSPTLWMTVERLMGSKTPYVMFGHNRLLGEFADLIHANDGVLIKIVQNMAEVPVEGRKTLPEYLQRITSSQDGIMPEVVPIDSFSPTSGEKFLIGFAGYQQQALRDLLADRFGLAFKPLVHPFAYVSPTVQVPAGCVIMARTVIASNVHIEEHVFINRNASIGHDSHLAKFCIVQPGANLAGHITVEEGALIGIGATVIEDQTIGHHAVVAAGAVVTREVPPGTLVAGVPAEVKKQIYPV